MKQTNKDLMGKALSEIRRLKAENAKLQSADREPIAIVGMSCRFPGGADDPEKYWQLLHAGRSAVARIPDERWNVEAHLGEDAETPGKMYSPYASMLSDFDRFDAAFFGISPKEAQSLDPQQRLSLEMAWEALENANIPSDSIADRRIGVFLGLSGIDYAIKLFDPENQSNIDPYFGTGSLLSPAAGRISYFLKITGPSMVVDTACSSSLVSIHLACQALRKGECEGAFAGGTNLILNPQLTVNFSKSGLLAADGQCYTFDARAHGYSRGEGAGMFYLKRLSDAKEAGDRIHALILGSAVNQDGGSSGLTVPRGLSQQEVIKEALKSAGLKANAIDYIETHGTATPLGDPIELNSLGAVFQNAKSKEQPLYIGSVKTNFGHLEAAAGMASTIKVIQSLRHQNLPPHLNFANPTPHFDWEQFPLEVVDENQAWSRNERPRIAGINGFGFSGTNAHVILSEAPVIEKESSQPSSNDPELLIASAKSPDALKSIAAKYADALGEPASLSAFCQTAQEGRTAFRERFAIAGKDADSIKQGLLRFAEKGKARGMAVGQSVKEPSVAFVFTGQGAQYTGMGKSLYADSPFFKSTIDECAERLKDTLNEDIREVLFAEPHNASNMPPENQSILHATRNAASEELIDQTRFTQPCLFVIEYALAKLWQHWGIQPACVLGHSIGEYAAACVAGVFSLEDGLKLVTARGKLMEELSPEGEMLTVFAEEDQIEPIIAAHEKEVAIAAVNGPGIILVSGARKAMRELSPKFEQAGFRTSPMRITHAFHSPMTESVLTPFREVAEGLRFATPKIPLISNVTGKRESEFVATPEYWVQHLRQKVRFCESMTALHGEQHDILLEIGPDPTLQGLDLCFREIQEKLDSKSIWASSLRRGQDDKLCLLESLGKLWVNGANLCWNTVLNRQTTERVDLPSYPFQRKRHWFPFPERKLPVSPDTTTAQVEPSPPQQLSTMPTSVPLQLNPQSHSKPSMDSIFASITDILAEVSGLEPGDLSPETNLLELGLDSLMFVRIGRKLETLFAVDIPLKEFYQNLYLIHNLSNYIHENSTVSNITETSASPQDQIASEQTESTVPNSSPIAQYLPPTPASSHSEIDRVMQEHLNLMQRYMAIKQGGSAPEFSANTTESPAKIHSPVKVDSTMHANFAGVDLNLEPGLSPDQKSFINGLIDRLTKKTAGSKAHTENSRGVLADWKHSLQFKRTLKELKYPIVSDAASGCRIRDIDGNEFIDVAMGMGTHFFGHKPDFIQKALHQQIDASTTLGPQSNLTSVVANKIQQLTGVERVSFAVSGSAAVLLATRLARAATGKAKIAQFGGAYHGIGSEVLMMGDESAARPLSPGIPYNLADNVLYLDYGSFDALDAIRQNAAELAAILVEPVQSRRPGFQPQRFLRKLRQLTEELGIVLIFDEMINGFRIHPGGAQAWFGIEADIVTYGKIIGGGMPLSIVAGKARYLDLIDGGTWNFGDDSHPNTQTIFTGGTHNRHPLALAAANATLDRMLMEGPELHQKLNRLTNSMIGEINEFFERESVSLRASSFGSQFRIESLSNAFEQELFHYVLLDNGVYTWEQRINCLSTQHTTQDVQQIVDAVKASVQSLRNGGFAMKANSGASRRIFPLSSVQERIFALCQRDGAEMPYHLSGIWELSGKIDAQRIQDAFQVVINRHESLRTAFLWLNGEPRQVILPEPTFSLEILDAQADGPTALLDKFVRPFDLENPPLIRVGLAQESDNSAFLLVDVHHVAADGLSMNTILKEFAAIYDGGTLRPVTRQYRHAQQLIEQIQSSGKWDTQLQFWKTEFSDTVPILNLPLDFARPPVSDFAGDRLLLRLPMDVTRKLEQFAAQQGASLFMVLLAAFATLLHRMSHAEDLVIGIPVGGRGKPENDPVVGMFVNSLPVRLQPKGNLSIKAFIQHVRDAAFAAFDHQDYPFGELLQHINVEVSPDRNPLFDVMFAYENADERIMRTSDLEVRTIDQLEGSGMFDFNVDVIREQGVLNIRFHYATSLFERDTIQRWADYYNRILEGLITEIDTPLGQLPILSNEEFNTLLHGQASERLGTTAHPTLIEAWNHSVARSKNDPALICGDRILSYLDADQLANGVADALKSKVDIRRDSAIALCLDSTEWLPISILGILKTGAAYVPIDPANPVERIHYILRDSAAVAVISDHPLSGEALPEDIVEVETSEIQPSATAPQLAQGDGSDLAYLIYTSGSTGRPKGVMIENRSIMNTLSWRVAYYGFSKTDTTLQMPSMAFDASVADIFPTLMQGGRLILLPKLQKEDLQHLGHLIKKHRVSNLLLTPGLYQLMLTEIGRSLEALRWVTLAGENLPLSLVKQHFKHCPNVRLFNEYGPTESSVIISTAELSPACSRVTIGKPIDGTSVHIVSPHGQLCPTGVTGELCVSGDGLARGYLNQPELTQSAFAPHSCASAARVYRTGDLARWLPNGEIEFLGRKDNQVKIRGYRIELEEVVSALLLHPGVKQATALVQRDPDQIIAYVVTERDGSETRLRAHLAARLPHYMVPNGFIQLDQIPLTQNGKVDTKKLPRYSTDSAAHSIKAPRNIAEKSLLRVWSEVLKRDKLSIDDDFFRVGGDSIKGIQIVSRLKGLGWDLDMRMLFRLPTIELLAPHIRELGNRSSLPTEKLNKAPLNAIQRWFARSVQIESNHYNLSVWLDCSAPVDPIVLEASLQDLEQQHAALKLHFSGEAQHLDEAAPIRLKVIDDTAKSDEDVSDFEYITAQQASLDLQNGPLWSALLFRGEESDRLFITAHHLVVDGLSWRILLEDLNTCYAARLSGKTVDWVTTGAFLESCNAPLAESSQEAVHEQLSYWKQICSGPSIHWPEELPQRAKTLADFKSYSPVPNPAHSSETLHKAQRAFNMQTEEVLLSALRLAWQEWNPGHCLFLEKENHGRNCSIFKNMDLSRTVGWFTTLVPLRFDALEETDLASILAITKDQMRGLPNEGNDYLLLREIIAPDAFGECHSPELAFNYLGRFERGSGPFQLSAQRPPSDRSPKQKPLTAVNLYGMEIDDRLQWTLEYDGKRFPEDSMVALMEAFDSALSRIISFCAHREPTSTPADFAISEVTWQDWQNVLGAARIEPASIEDAYPLRPMQEGLLYEYLRDPKTEAYFEQMTFRMEGALNLEAFKLSWQDLVDRHPALRSSFLVKDAPMPVQVIWKHRQLPIEIIDLRQSTPPEKESAIRRFEENDRNNAFDLTLGPLMRLTVFQLDSNNVHIVWSHHHIIMDGWCVGILYEDWQALYEARISSSSAQLPPPADIRPYLQWLQTWDRNAAREFWNGQLEGLPHVTSLPKLQQAESIQGYAYQELNISLDAGKWHSLQESAAHLRTTTSNVLQALWALCLARLNDTDDVCFGLIVSGRPESIPQIEKMVGLFINAIPVRVSLQNVQTIESLVQRMHTISEARHGHEYLPLAEINECSDSVSTAFDHLFVLENYPMEEELRNGERTGPETGNLRLYQVEGYERTHLDFNLIAVPGECLELKFTYNAAVIEPAVIKRVADLYSVFIDTVLANPTANLGIFPTLSVEDEEQIREWNNRTVDYPTEATVTSLFGNSVEQFPNRTALRCGEEELSYAELNQAANRLANNLIERGVTEHDRIAVWLPRDVRMVIAILGIQKAGAIFVPLDPEYPEERIRFILQDSEAQWVIHDLDHPFTGGAVPTVALSDTSTGSDVDPAIRYSPDSGLYVIYTSGSTGQPKGCQISHRNLVRLMTNTAFDFDFNEKDTWVVAHSFCFDFSVWELYGALLYGGCCVIASRETVRDTRQFLRLLAKEKITILNQTPAAFYALMDAVLQESKQPELAVRSVIFGGDRLNTSYLKPWVDIYPLEKVSLINMYGITETTVHVTFHRITQEEIESQGGQSIIGRPLPETTVWVLDKDKQLLPIGFPGELYVGGTGVSQGYLNRPELNAERFIDHPLARGGKLYRTGDLGRLREDGLLEYLGRNDHQVQIRGFRIEIGEIEAAFLKHISVEKVVVRSFEDTFGVQSLVAYYTGLVVEIDQFREYLKSLLPEYMIPSNIFHIEAFPLTANGKIDLNQLQPPAADETESGSGAAPRDALDERITQAWKDVLNKPTLSIDDNFFANGGQSLKAVRLASILESELGQPIDLSLIFSEPTIRRFADAIRSALPVNDPTDDADLRQLIEGLSEEDIEAQLNAIEN
jgi:amino acid adenylation domain-containing protein/non-ribosomal peptide synthase protein (TIGR01720 family)